jgi:nucleoside-diphosphate-sugar epimerase
MYNLTRLILESGKGLQLGDGKSFWNCVHIHDLSRLYIHLIDEAIFGGSKASWNSEGYYLVESGEYFWGDICRRITSEAYKLGLLASEDMVVLDMEKSAIMAPAGRPVANYTVKAKALRARKLLGWTPMQSMLQDEIPEIVKEEAHTHDLSLEVSLK